jgi:hypothetical protein
MVQALVKDGRLTIEEVQKITERAYNELYPANDEEQ